MICNEWRLWLTHSLQVVDDHEKHASHHERCRMVVSDPEREIRNASTHEGGQYVS